MKKMLRAGYVTCFFVTLSHANAAYVDGHNSTNISNTDVQEKSTSDVIAVITPQDISVIDWNFNDKNELSIWDGWKYGFDIPQILTASAGNTFYGFGVWQPDEYKNLSFGEVSTSDWIKSHGLNVSFGTRSSDSETRYRFDVRWHEDTDAELMLQMQIPFK